MGISDIIAVFALVVSGIGLWFSIKAGRRTQQIKYEASRRLLVTQLMNLYPRLEDVVKVLRDTEQAIASVPNAPDFASESPRPYFEKYAAEFRELVGICQSSEALEHVDVERRITEVAVVNQKLLLIEEKIRIFEDVISLGRRLSEIEKSEAVNKSLNTNASNAGAD